MGGVCSCKVCDSKIDTHRNLLGNSEVNRQFINPRSL
jgi:hypothetical protein